MIDLIRRSDAKDAVMWGNGLDGSVVDDICEKIDAIPSAESTGDLDNAIYEYVQDGLMSNPYDRPQGEWIYRTDVGWHAVRQCSLCGWTQSYSDTKYMGYRYNYCPHCGAHMKGADDE